jgi:hypothetical protein
MNDKIDDDDEMMLDVGGKTQKKKRRRIGGRIGRSRTKNNNKNTIIILLITIGMKYDDLDIRGYVIIISLRPSVSVPSVRPFNVNNNYL